MSSNYYNGRGCRGCQGGFKCHGCSSCNDFQMCPRRRDNCRAFGPFVAIDANCITTPPNTGTIIPFSSGIVDAILTSIAGGLVGTTSLVGFGTSIPGITIVGNTLDLTALADEAFVVPRAGGITAISASFKVLAALAIAGTTITVNAQVYRAPAGSGTFTATGASVNLSPLAGPLAIGDIAFGSNSFAPIPVAAGDNLVMVFSITAAGTTLVNIVTGSASAGITIQ